MHEAPQIVAVAHGNGQEKLLFWSRQKSRSRYGESVAKRGQMDEGMVPVSWLEARDLQQWEHEVETMQTKDDN